MSMQAKEGPAKTKSSNAVVYGGDRDANAAALVGAPDASPKRRRPKLHEGQNQQLVTGQALADHRGQQSTPMTPNHGEQRRAAEMKAAAIAGDQRVHSYHMKAKSQKDASHRKIVPSGRDSGIASNQQKLSQSIQALQQKHKSIDEYKTQISNQIRSIKAGVNSGLDQHSMQPQQTWHVSFKASDSQKHKQSHRQALPPPKYQLESSTAAGDGAFLIPTREVLENQLESRIQNEYGQQLIDQIHYATSEAAPQYRLSPAKKPANRNEYMSTNQAMFEAESGFLPSIDKRTNGDPSSTVRMNRTGGKIAAVEAAMMAAQGDRLGSRGGQRHGANNHTMISHEISGVGTDSSASRRHPRSVKHTDKKASKLRDDANQALVFAQAQKQHKRNSNADLGGGGKHRTQPTEQRSRHDRDRVNMSQIKGKQEKQLEDLNETLQRLAREKYTKNTPGGAGGLQGNRSRKTRQDAGGAHSKTSGHAVPPGLDPNTMLQMDPFSAQLAEINAQAQARREKKKRRANKSQDATSKKKEEQQQQSANFIGDALVNTRLQGVKGTEKHRVEATARREEEYGEVPGQNRRNVVITPQEPIVLKNANIVMAQRQFVQTTTNMASNTQANFSVRYPNLVVSDTEDTGHDHPTIFPMQPPQRQASQRPPPTNKHYMTHTQAGFEVLAGGRVMHFQSASKKRPANLRTGYVGDRHVTSQGQSEACSGDIEEESKTPGQLPVPTQRSGDFSSVLEEEEPEQSPLLRLRGAEKALTVASSPNNPPSPPPNIKSAYTSIDAQLSELQASKQSPQQQAALLEQMKQIYQSPNRPSGIQLIKCEAERSNEHRRQFAGSSRQGDPSLMSNTGSRDRESPVRSGSRDSASAQLPAGGQGRGRDVSEMVTAFDAEDSRFDTHLRPEDGLRSADVGESARHSNRSSVGIEATGEQSRNMIVGAGAIQRSEQRHVPPSIRESFNVLTSMDGLGRRSSAGEGDASEDTAPGQRRSQVRRVETDKLTPARAGEARQLDTLDVVPQGRNITIDDSDGGSRSRSRKVKKSGPRRKATLESPGEEARRQRAMAQAQSRPSPAEDHASGGGPSAGTTRRDRRLMKSPSRLDGVKPPLPKGSSPDKQPMTHHSSKMASKSPPGEQMMRTSASRREKHSGSGRKGPSAFPTNDGGRAQSIERVPPADDGYVSSDAPPAAVQLQLGRRIPRDWASYCQEYVMMKGQYTKRMAKEAKNLFTKRRYFKHKVRPEANEQGTTAKDDGDHDSFTWSQRLYLSRECATSEDRRQLPVLIVNLDGAVGYWDEQKRLYYVLRHKVVEGLIQLSYDFRLIAVSSARKRLICKVVQGLMCMPMTDEQRPDTQLRHLVFDAVYQLRTQNQDSKWGSYVKNIDEVHFDISQILLDMQFKPHKKDAKHRRGGHARTFQTFWETELYRPHHKVLIVTTARDLFGSTCYSYDYNYLYQAFKFRHEEKKRSPVVIQVPHLRTQPKQAFDAVLQLIFSLQNVANANNLKAQPGYRLIDGQKYLNPGYIPYEVVKKLLATKFRQLHAKMRKTAPAKGLRVFDCGEDPFVDLEGIDFSRAFGFLKKHFKGIPGLEAHDGDRRKSDWLQIKKYYLKYQPGKEPVSPQKIKQNLKVTFDESPEIRRGEERDKASSSMRAAATTHDSSKSDRFSIAKTHFTNEDAKNAYNGLMIRNFKIQQEINNYARHQRIQNQLKHERRKREEKRLAQQEAEESPIVIYDGDEREPMPLLKSSFKQQSQKTLRDLEPPPGTPQIKEKPYAFKYQVLQVRCGEPIEEAGEYDFSRHHVINLLAQVPQPTPAVRTIDSKQRAAYRVHTFQAVMQEMTRDKGRHAENALVELLSKRQTKIQYTTNQEMHLANNLRQLVDGEQQYKDQHQMLMDEEEVKKGEKVLSAREKKTRDDYIDNL